ncbi:MAG: HEAT repeat domain-containing protein [Deltaproteobacteria bacterium]|nr:HEAT repeat domain-containing protein [Deltaproteobacteria bacterium]
MNLVCKSLLSFLFIAIFSDQLEAQSRPSAGKLITALDEQDPAVQLYISRSLSRLGDKALPALVAGLDNPDQATQWAIAVAISDYEEKAFSSLTPLLDSSNPFLKRGAIMCFGAIGKKADSFVPKILPNLQNPNLTIKAASIFALGQMGEKSAPAIPTLIEEIKNPIRGMQSPDDVPLAGVAVAALGAIGEPAIIPLCIALNDKSNDALRENALGAFSEMGEKALPALPNIIEAMNDKVFVVRMRAIFTLGDIGEKAAETIPQIRKILMEAIGSNKSARDDIEEAATYALSQMGESGVAPLREALKIAKDLEKIYLLRALGEIGPKAAVSVPDLIQELNNPDFRIFYAATFALGEIGEAASPAVPKLIEMMKDNQRTWGAVEALGNIGPKASAVLPRLKFLLSIGEDGQMKKHILEAIKKISAGDVK